MDRNSGIFSRGDNLYKKVYTCAMFKLEKNITNNIFFKEFGKKIKSGLEWVGGELDSSLCHQTKSYFA